MKNLFFILLSVLILVSCSENKNLISAREALWRAKNCPEVVKYAKEKLAQAEDAYAKAEDSKDFNDIYYAKRRAEIALAYAKAQMTENEFNDLKKTYDEKMAIAAAQAKAKEDELARLKAELAEKERLLKEKEEEQLKTQKELEDAIKGVGEVKKDERGLVVYFSDILFDFDKKNLRPAAQEALIKLAGVLDKHPQYKINVEGHTDSIGSDEYNMKLSNGRAGSVADFLIGHGIGSDRVTTKGYGETKPVADNKTPEGRQRNRRVEIILSE